MRFVLGPVGLLGLLGLLVMGCAPASEDASLHLGVDRDGVMVWIAAGTSANGVDVELDWSMALENRGTEPCPVAIYRWTDTLPASSELPVLGQAWPDSWDGGELIDSAVIEANAQRSWGPMAFDEPSEQIEGVLGLAVCPSAAFDLELRAQVSADLGVRSISDALVLELWRAD